MRIREARPEDAPTVAALLAQLGYPDGVEPARARLRAFEASSSSFALVVEDADTVLGLASASFLPLLHEEGSWCRLSALVVREDNRRAGLGRALVSAVEERAREADCRYLEVTSGEWAEREAAHAFYEALGLDQVSRRYLKKL